MSVYSYVYICAGACKAQNKNIGSRVVGICDPPKCFIISSAPHRVVLFCFVFFLERVYVILAVLELYVDQAGLKLREILLPLFSELYLCSHVCLDMCMHTHTSDTEKHTPQRHILNKFLKKSQRRKLSCS